MSSSLTRLYDFSGYDLHSPGMQERMLSVKI